MKVEKIREEIKVGDTVIGTVYEAVGGSYGGNMADGRPMYPTATRQEMVIDIVARWVQSHKGYDDCRVEWGKEALV